MIRKKKNSQRKIIMTLIQTMCPDQIALRVGKHRAPSADVGALAPVFEKSATELKLKPKPKYLDQKHSSHSNI